MDLRISRRDGCGACPMRLEIGSIRSLPVYVTSMQFTIRASARRFTYSEVKQP